MISHGYIRLKPLISFLLISISLSCTSHEMPEIEKSMQLQELISIPYASSRKSKSESIQNNRENTITRVVRQNRNAIVSVKFRSRNSFSEAKSRQTDIVSSKRSGFFVSSEGHVITKYRYNSDPAAEVVVRTIKGHSYPAKIVGSDPFSGITLLKVESNIEHEYVGFGNSDSLMAGEWSIAMGLPVDESGMVGQPSVSAGVINALNCTIENPDISEIIYPEMIRTDAVITASSEGGPMLNANGRVIGLNTFIPYSSGGEDAYGHGYAIPGNKVARMVNHLADGDNLALNYSVGLEMVPVTKKIADRYNLTVAQGLFVLGVNTDGPAYEGGILPGDVIVRIGQDLIYGDTHAWAVLRQFDKGDQMPVILMRGDSKVETQILLRERLKELGSNKN